MPDFSLSGSIKLVRAHFGESLTAFAKRLPAERMTLYSWEQGSMQPRLKSLTKLFEIAIAADLPQYAVAMLEPTAEQSGLPLGGVLLGALMRIEGFERLPDSRALAKLAKRAAEILEAAGK